MNLRTHQTEMLYHAMKIAGGSNTRQIIAAVTPGGGKSMLPVILAAKLIPKMADKICWIVPRVALQLQAEESFTDNDFRKRLEHKHLIRVSTNEPDPSRGLAGFTTTYAAVASGSEYNLNDFKKYRYILVIDEGHHIALSSAAMEHVKPLVESAVLTLFMSGTFERGRGEKIAFLDYAKGHEVDELSLRNTDTRKIITYSRVDALREKAIIPLRFTFLDVKASWTENGKAKSVETLRGAKKKVAKKALFTALQTQYAIDLMHAAVSDWQQLKKTNADAKLLVVAPSQKLAKKYADELTRLHIATGLATVSEGSKALKSIKRFKSLHSERYDALATVGMAYEGLDVKQITHIACLTRIRSKPWIEQMLARASRFDPGAGPWETQEAHVFLPDDPEMHRTIDAIKREQAAFCKQNGEFHGERAVPSGMTLNIFGDIVPVDSGVSGKRATKMNPKLPPPPPRELTPSEREEMLRNDIESHVRQFAIRTNTPIKKANTRVYARFGKSRTVMRLDELEKTLTWVKGNLR